VVEPRDLVDSYMAPFQDCVEIGQVTGLMCSYNAVNGVPSCANHWMLETVARGQWGFDGYITSDCEAEADVFTNHKYTKTPEEAVLAILEAGTDVDCGSFLTKYTASALNKSIITEALIDKRLSKLFRVRFRLGHFDPAGPLQQIPPSAVCTPDAIKLAREGAIQGSVLLKNQDNFLPLNEQRISSLAVIGPNSNLSQKIAGYYGGDKPCGLKFWNAVDAMAQYVPNTATVMGVPSVTSSDTSGIPAAVEAAKKADMVVLAVGQDLTIEREGQDRSNISLSDAQQQLINAVVDASSKPVLVLILTAGAVDISFMKENKKIGAIIHAGQPSVTILGVGDLVFGERSPAGRMVQTTYPDSFVNQISIFDMNMRPGNSSWPRPDCNSSPCPHGKNPGRTHRFYTGETVIPFGFGLSYTTWKYELVSGPGLRSENNAVLDASPVHGMLSAARGAGRPEFPELETAMKPLTTFAVNVTNTGKFDADDVVLGFLTPPQAGQNGVPIQSLFGFERVHVKAGQTVTVYLAAGYKDFTLVSEEGHRNVGLGQYKAHFGVRESKQHGMGFAETQHFTLE